MGGKLKNMHPDRQKKIRDMRDNYIGPVQALNKATVMGIFDREQRKIRTTRMKRGFMAASQKTTFTTL